jgi:hypothetical protein
MPNLESDFYFKQVPQAGNRFLFVKKIHLDLILINTNFVFQSISMIEGKNSHLEQLQEIRSIMAKSSRFISLSGWSGVFAGSSALIGALFANSRINYYYHHDYAYGNINPQKLLYKLIWIAILVFCCAVLGAFFFTLQKSKQDKTPIWNQVAFRLLWNTLLPILVGEFFILKLGASNHYELVIPSCLLFYGLGLVNGSKYTLGEVRYLVYATILIGIINLIFVKEGLVCWTLGFGVFHIVYGFMMCSKYEKKIQPTQA